jgi:Flp pilus assembly protein TadG
MVLDLQRDKRLLRLERGSALIEGTVALAIAFLLLALVVHVGLFVAARSTAETAVGSAARRAARPGATVGGDDLVALIEASVIGSTNVTASVSSDQQRAVTVASFVWNPPGPSFGTIRMTVRASEPIVVPP